MEILFVYIIYNDQNFFLFKVVLSSMAIYGEDQA